MLALLFALLLAVPALPVSEGDHVIRDFKFASGETLPELRIHYRTLGKLDRRNAVLILHESGGRGAPFINPALSGGPFWPGPLPAPPKEFIVLPAQTGHGKSSQPTE